MFLGYNTNGLAHHDLFDAVELLAEIGYRGVAITIDHNAMPPHDNNADRNIARLQKLLKQYQMRSVVETGARFLLNPRVKHEPTLLSEDRRRRIEFTKYAIELAARLGSDCVSLWSGVLREPLLPEQAMNRLVEGLAEVLDYASRHGVPIGFEPEPGMLIDTMAAFETLWERIDAPNLRLTLDIGHLHCQGEMSILVAQPPSAVTCESHCNSHSRGRLCHILKRRLANVHIEDMRAGVHEHLMFGEGEIDFPPVLRALAEVGYTGGLYVELSRHSHEGAEAAKRAFEFLAKTTIL